jgi:hypothetical protein
MDNTRKVVLDEIAAGELAGIRATVMHEVTRKRDLDMNRTDPKADETYFQSAVSVWHRMRHQHDFDALIFVTVGGYDDDPRSLWEIPEVVAFVGRWIEATGCLREKRLLPLTRAVLERIHSLSRPIRRTKQ